MCSAHPDVLPAEVLDQMAGVVGALEVPIRHGRHDAVPEVVTRGHRALDELTTA